MIIEENDKVYNLDLDKGIVTEAASKEAGLSEDPEKVDTMEELDRPVSIGAHVEVEGKLGEVVATTESVYGIAYGVSFEDGSFEEYPREDIKTTKVEKVAYSSPLTEVVDRYVAYQELPAFTVEELETKGEEARFLNLRSKSLITGKASFDEQRTLDEIIVATTADLLDIKEAKEAALLESNKTYLSSFNRFSLQNEVTSGGPALGHNEDASWLNDAEFEVSGHTDAELAERATEVVNNFTHEQLNDAAFVETASSFQREYLNLDELGSKKFAAYVDLARRERLKEPEKKTAKVEEQVDLDSFDLSAIYLSGE